MTTSTHGQPSPLPWLSLPSYWPCDLSAQPCLSFRTELGTFQWGQEGEGSDSVDRGLDPEMDLLSSGSLGWHQGPGIEPREDLGLSPHPACHVFITSKHQDLAPCPPNSSHHPPVGELPPASDGDRRCPGWGRPPVHILRTNPQILILNGFVFILIFLFCFFLIRIFILSTFILKEFVLCIGGAGSRAEGGGPWGWAGLRRAPLSPDV